MIELLKKWILVVVKEKLKRKHKIVFKKNVSINLSNKYEGGNTFYYGCIVKNSRIGYGTYIGKNSVIKNMKLGRYCSIGPGLKPVFGNHPTKLFVSTHPSFYSLKKQAGFTYVKHQKFEEYAKPASEDGKYSIEIGNDVWIGEEVLILDGVYIGDGAIVASGSTVTKDVQPYSIVGGVPAKEIRKRFTEDEIKFLLNFRWWDKPKEWIRQNAQHFGDISVFMKLSKTNEI